MGWICIATQNYPIWFAWTQTPEAKKKEFLVLNYPQDIRKNLKHMSSQSFEDPDTPVTASQDKVKIPGPAAGRQTFDTFVLQTACTSMIHYYTLLTHVGIYLLACVFHFVTSFEFPWAWLSPVELICSSTPCIFLLNRYLLQL